jgi:HPt (histidine-containing phosphotransfer) domain-containing protein
MATPIDQDFFARLRALNDKFAASIPQTLARMRQQRRACDPEAPDSETIRALQETLHTIAGSAATFGFRTFGQQARLLEQRLRVLMAFASVPQGDWQRWFAALDAYIDWAERDPKGGDAAGGPEDQ